MEEFIIGDNLIQIEIERGWVTAGCYDGDYTDHPDHKRIMENIGLRTVDGVRNYCCFEASNTTTYIYFSKVSNPDLESTFDLCPKHLALFLNYLEKLRATEYVAPEFFSLQPTPNSFTEFELELERLKDFLKRENLI